MEFIVLLSNMLHLISSGSLSLNNFQNFMKEWFAVETQLTPMGRIFSRSLHPTIIQLSLKLGASSICNDLIVSHDGIVTCQKRKQGGSDTYTFWIEECSPMKSQP